MEYKEFISMIKERVEDVCGLEGEVIINCVKKNNNVVWDAIMIKRPGENVTPTIYLRNYYDAYLRGVDIEDIVEQIIETDIENRKDIKISVEDFENYDNIKGRVIFKLINRERNEELLKTVPHKEIFDLSIVYCCLWEYDVIGSAITLITNKHLELWNISEEELYKLAKLNTVRLCEPTLVSMNEMMIELFSKNQHYNLETSEALKSLKEDDDVLPMYIITNDRRFLGANGLLYESIMKEFYKKFGEFYIIPSSIHELILIPIEYGSDEEYLLNMVFEINSTEVSREEYLSDNIYRYDKTGFTLINNFNKNAASVLLN